MRTCPFPCQHHHSSVAQGVAYGCPDCSRALAWNVGYEAGVKDSQEMVQSIFDQANAERAKS